MQKTTVWIDHVKAYIYNYDARGAHPTTLEYDGPVSHGKRSSEHEKKFYHQVAKALENSERVLLLGPGTAKEEFKNHCAHHHPNINKAIIKIENMKDHPTTEEILEYSGKIFKEYYSWNGL